MPDKGGGGGGGPKNYNLAGHPFVNAPLFIFFPEQQITSCVYSMLKPGTRFAASSSSLLSVSFSSSSIFHGNEIRFKLRSVGNTEVKVAAPVWVTILPQD